MVATACTSSGSSLLENSKSKEESKESNISFVVLEKHRNGVCDYGVCVANYDEGTQKLYLCMKGETYSYCLDEIQDQYHILVKNNKVTLARVWGEFIPVVVEKDKTPCEKHPVYNDDYRSFTFKSILKDSNVTTSGFYFFVYNGMFLNGLCNAGNQVYEDGRYFFSKKDFDPEYDYSDIDKGYISAGLALFDSSSDFYRKDKAGEYRYAVVISYYEDDYLILRIEDGQIYRFPVNIMNIQAKAEVKRGKPVGALQLSNRRWIPVFLHQGYGQYYSMSELLLTTHDTYNLRGFNNLMFYSDFMLEVGITTSYQPVDYFFYKWEKTK